MTTWPNCLISKASPFSRKSWNYGRLRPPPASLRCPRPRCRSPSPGWTSGSAHGGATAPLAGSPWPLPAKNCPRGPRRCWLAAARELGEEKCVGYGELATAGGWNYTNSGGEQASVRPAGPLRVNNGEALMPALLAGLGIADLPEFIVGDAIASGEVEVILKDWKQTEGSVHLVTPPGGPRPARVEVLADFLTKQFAKGKRK